MQFRNYFHIPKRERERFFQSSEVISVFKISTDLKTKILRTLKLFVEHLERGFRENKRLLASDLL